MKVLLDECLPKRLARALAPHEAKLAPAGGSGRDQEWPAPLARRAGDDVFVTIDQELEYQQNLDTLPIAVVVLRAKSNRFADVAPLVPQLLMTLQQLFPRTLVHVGPVS